MVVVVLLGLLGLIWGCSGAWVWCLCWWLARLLVVDALAQQIVLSSVTSSVVVGALVVLALVVGALPALAQLVVLSSLSASVVDSWFGAGSSVRVWVVLRVLAVVLGAARDRLAVRISAVGMVARRD